MKKNNITTPKKWYIVLFYTSKNKEKQVILLRSEDEKHMRDKVFKRLKYADPIVKVHIVEFREFDEDNFTEVYNELKEKYPV